MEYVVDFEMLWSSDVESVLAAKAVWETLTKSREAWLARSLDLGWNDASSQSPWDISPPGMFSEIWLIWDIDGACMMYSDISQDVSGSHSLWSNLI